MDFFVKELNVGWEEWAARGLPTHAERVPAGELRCSCSDHLPRESVLTI